MKKAMLIVVVCFLLSSCGLKQKQKQSDVQEITAHSYHVSDVQFTYYNPKQYDEGKDVFLIKDEMQLSRLLQYRYDIHETRTTYQSESEMDLDKINNILVHMNPFDIKLIQTSNEYKDQQGNELYHSYEIEMINLDNSYEDSKQLVKDILANIMKDDMSQVEQMRTVHDYLIDNITYNDHAVMQKQLYPTAFSVSGALLENSAVCAGYARAFMLFMEELNIPCMYMSSAQIDHSWNYVFDGNQWINIDVTWDDHDDGNHYYDYFNLEDSVFYADGRHILDKHEAKDFYTVLTESFF